MSADALKGWLMTYLNVATRHVCLSVTELLAPEICVLHGLKVNQRLCLASAPSACVLVLSSPQPILAVSPRWLLGGWETAPVLLLKMISCLFSCSRRRSGSTCLPYVGRTCPPLFVTPPVVTWHCVSRTSQWSVVECCYTACRRATA
jgi:hypothetical protein